VSSHRLDSPDKQDQYRREIHRDAADCNGARGTIVVLAVPFNSLATGGQFTRRTIRDRKTRFTNDSRRNTTLRGAETAAELSFSQVRSSAMLVAMAVTLPVAHTTSAARPAVSCKRYLTALF
jgi:hypothetical protein